MLQTPATTDREVTMFMSERPVATSADFETESEREEREAVTAGNDWPLLSDSERTERDDEVALDAEELSWSEQADADNPRYMFARY